MAKFLRITGVPNLLKNLEKSAKVVNGNIEKGLIKAGLFLQRKSQEIVPVQFGFLKASAYTRMSVAHSKTMTGIVSVGYTAAYAVYVHENLEAAHGRAYNVKHKEEIMNPDRAHTVRSGNFQRGSAQQAKFLEAPCRTYRMELLRIILQTAKDKK